MIGLDTLFTGGQLIFYLIEMDDKGKGDAKKHFLCQQYSLPCSLWLLLGSFGSCCSLRECGPPDSGGLLCFNYLEGSPSGFWLC